MYKAPITINSTALNQPFYLLLNMAVGGNFTPAATPAQVTAPLPATTYVDYVRVYELDGLGEVKLGVGHAARGRQVRCVHRTTRRWTTSRCRASPPMCSSGTRAP